MPWIMRSVRNLLGALVREIIFWGDFSSECR